MRNSKITAAFFILIALLLILSVSVFGSTRYYSTVQRIFGAYRMEVDLDQMWLSEVDQNGESFTISVQSPRNSFEMVMLIGFYAAGKAILECNQPIQKVTMIVSVEYKGVEKIFATASRADILKFVNGDLLSEEFVRLVEYNS